MEKKHGGGFIERKFKWVVMGKREKDEHRFLFFSRARSCALAWFARCQTVKINLRAVELSEKGKTSVGRQHRRICR